MKDRDLMTPTQEDASETEMDTPPSKAGKPVSFFELRTIFKFTCLLVLITYLFS